MRGMIGTPMTIEYASKNKKRKAYYKSKEFKDLVKNYSQIGGNEQKLLDRQKNKSQRRKSKKLKRSKNG